MRRLRVPVLLIGALAALLVFSAAAAAETRTGESASPFNLGTPARELKLVKGSASYETTGGSVRFDITTAAAPQTESEGAMAAELLSVSGECSLIGLLNLHLEDELPMLKIVDEYKEPDAAALVISSLTEILPPLPATKTRSGTTTTLSFTSSAIADKGYNCAVVTAADLSLSPEEPTSSGLIFPISAPPPAPPAPPTAPPATAPAPDPPAPPAPTPAALSIGTLKPLTLKAERWKTVSMTVRNTGGTATTQGSLQVRAPAKVLVKPERQKLPALAPGESWKVSVRVWLPAKAKKKTTLQLVGTASGVSATRSLVIRLKH